MRTVILGVFALHFIFLAYLNNVYVAGLPVRSFLILLAGGLVVMRDYTTLFRIGLASKVYLLLAMLGLVVSLANNVTPGNIANGELKLLQSYLMILVSFFVVEQFGFRTLGYLVVGIALPSALVGIMQALDVQFAWKLQGALAGIQNKELSDEIQSQITEALLRPPGLSLYAIPQTYMLLGALMLNLYLVLQNRYNPRFQMVAVVVGLILAGGIFASETRSAMGAALLMPALIYLFLFPARVIPATGLLVLLGGLAFVLLADKAGIDSRMISLDDASAAGRSTLYKYGTELFLRQPFGYGFNFDTVEYAVQYFVNDQNLFNYDPSEKAHYIVPVHNSILNLVHTFGFAGVFLLVYYVYRLIAGSWYRAVFILGAFVNSLFHNAGILSNDLFMDMVIAVMLYELYRQHTAATGTAVPAR
ncbi:O-antigen ligase family protein [Thiothrix lacustris]|uniref:O-antigen ligase family protein n=1 Tax=Thiothrix lacustris TaxID=525917 RepID=A0ABY9MLP6_9GAMM|nr:O-antigen ligase family protein [Thiothrix lacustris]WML89130.1 O-antigen ligase family protein [Thiothrix lacustris]